MLLLAVVGLVGSFTAGSTALQFRSALVTAAIVIALYVFIGNSGVLSFGHISFVAVGAFAAASDVVAGGAEARGGSARTCSRGSPPRTSATL